jgi:hypothetical protein
VATTVPRFQDEFDQLAGTAVAAPHANAQVCAETHRPFLGALNMRGVVDGIAIA